MTFKEFVDYCKIHYPTALKDCRFEEVGPGWFQLIEKLLAVINAVPDVEIFQIKEKFGQLRVYTSITDNPYVRGAITIAHDVSQYICEECGQAGELRRFENGLVKTLCKNHYENHID